MQITAAELTTINVEPDGLHVRMSLRDTADRAAAVVLPFHCLTQLLMTLPSTIGRALRLQYGDESLRLVHELKEFRVELGEPNAAGVTQLIVTLATSGGFAVSFSMSEADLESLGRVDDFGTAANDPVPYPSRRLS